MIGTARTASAYHVWRVRWYAGGQERSRTFDRAADAQAFEAKVKALKRKDALGELDAGKETLAAFAEEWWELYAKPNLSRNTLDVYARFWNRYALPKLGGYRLRELTPSIISRFRVELEREEVGPRGDPQDDDDPPEHAPAGGRVGADRLEPGQGRAQAAGAAPARRPALAADRSRADPAGT